MVTFRTIELLRGLAALSVAVAHADSLLGANPALPFGRWHAFAMPGTAGVEFFFVLSGFVMAVAHRADIARGGNFGRFLWRRFRRIYPLYWVVLLVPLHRFWGAPLLTPDAIAAWFSLLPIRTDSILVVAWTLRQEVTFYLMLALCLLPWIGRAMLAAWVAATLAWWFLPHPAPPPGLPTTVLSHVFSLFNFEFFAGLLAGWMLPHWPRRPAFGWALLATGLAGLAWRMSLDGWGVDYGPLHARPIYGAAYAAIILACATLERDGAIAFGSKAVAFTAFAGAISYPLYLSHLLTLDEAADWLGASGIAARIGPDATVVAMLAATIAVAAALAGGVDQPLQRVLRRFSADSRSRRPLQEPPQFPPTRPPPAATAAPTATPQHPVPAIPARPVQQMPPPE